jgi:hypothetical protein
MTSLINTFARNLLHLPGWHINRKIVVIESDDWGSIRMPSKQVYQDLLDKGIAVNNLSYNRYDSLASETDLSALFDVLHSVKDKNGRPAVITANTIVANPDFDKIRASGFSQYFYEPFTETLKRYPEHQKSFEIWKQGINAGVFKPQFHGREHLNVKRWLRALREDIGHVRLAFDYQMFDLSTDTSISQNSFMEALNFEDKKELEFQKTAIIEGTMLFERILGYRSISFIAPCYTWSNEINATLKDAGIQCFQGSWFQFEPVEGVDHKFRKVFHYTGQRNKLGQIYLVRNAAFEPSDAPDFDWTHDILSRAKIAFRLGKPLIIGSHRINYIGFIDQLNRKRNLPKLKNLLLELLKQWPDIEFMSSDELCNLIIGK